MLIREITINSNLKRVNHLSTFIDKEKVKTKLHRISLIEVLGLDFVSYIKMFSLFKVNSIGFIERTICFILG